MLTYKQDPGDRDQQNADTNKSVSIPHLTLDFILMCVGGTTMPIIWEYGGMYYAYHTMLLWPSAYRCGAASRQLLTNMLLQLGIDKAGLLMKSI